ncbi:MAG: acetate--CoA ligase [Desulfatiglandaceae bacterium]
MADKDDQEKTGTPYAGSGIWPAGRYMDMRRRSLEDPEGFWSEQARKLDWYKTWDQVLDWDPPYAKWFVGGRLNACYQCVDRHVRSWRKSKVALYWEGESGEERVLSYSTLFREVNQFAFALKSMGIETGDRIALYLPMIPEVIVAMLACARVGAVHTVIFSGFSSHAVADRVQDTAAKLIITADGAYRRGKTIPLKKNIEEVIDQCSSVENIIVVKRTGEQVPMKEGRDHWLSDLMENAGMWVEPEAVEATHPLYILYTSGTTGKPKGIVHSTGGYMVFNHSGYQWVFNIQEQSIYWCTADIGWVTGHSQVVYAPLSHGAAVVIYEGAPDYPEVDRWWDIVEKYGVSILYTSPTAVRMFMRHGEKWPQKHDLSSLELLGTVGEPINPKAWQWYYTHIGGERCPIVDTWWQTETGGIMISPAPGIDPVPLKPGSVCFPLPGIDMAVVDNQGKEVEAGTRGELIIKRPWPGMLMNIYNDPDRYQDTYWSQFPGYYDAGDFAMRDEDGYVWVMGRSDEVLKVAGHRLGTVEVEDAVVSHPAVAEAAVSSKAHEEKGEALVLFVILKESEAPSDVLKEEVVKRVREAIGPIATPEDVYFVNSLPKTRSGKIMRRVLKAVASGEEVGDVSTLEDEASVDEVKKAYESLTQEAGA